MSETAVGSFTPYRGTLPFLGELVKGAKVLPKMPVFPPFGSGFNFVVEIHRGSFGLLVLLLTDLLPRALR